MKATQAPTEDTDPLTGEDLETIAAIPGILDVGAARNLTPGTYSLTDHPAAHGRSTAENRRQRTPDPPRNVESMGFTRADDA
jgi:hypothetical protein